MKTAQIEQIKTSLNILGLNHLRENLDQWLSQSNQESTPLTIIESFIEQELGPRLERQANTRIKLSGMPQRKSFDDFDLDWIESGLTENGFNQLKELDWARRAQNVLFMGPSGLGKTHLMLALGRKACEQGLSVYFTTLADLLIKLRRARIMGTFKRKMSWLAKPNLLLIDEVGHEKLGPDDANLLFQAVNTRYEKGSIVLTSNLPFGDWGEFMGNNAIATATLDRLLHHSMVFSLKGNSYRMKGRLELLKKQN